jgi:hypothetical protein
MTPETQNQGKKITHNGSGCLRFCGPDKGFAAAFMPTSLPQEVRPGLTKYGRGLEAACAAIRKWE